MTGYQINATLKEHGGIRSIRQRRLDVGEWCNEVECRDGHTVRLTVAEEREYLATLRQN